MYMTIEYLWYLYVCPNVCKQSHITYKIIKAWPLKKLNEWSSTWNRMAQWFCRSFSPWNSPFVSDDIHTVWKSLPKKFFLNANISSRFYKSILFFLHLFSNLSTFSILSYIQFSRSIVNFVEFSIFVQFCPIFNLVDFPIFPFNCSFCPIFNMVDFSVRSIFQFLF